MTTERTDRSAGLPAEVVEVITSAPAQEKMLAELELAWPGLEASQARMAQALRVFLLTWDPLEHHAARPAAFATVNAGPPDLEVVIYIPLWTLAAAAEPGKLVVELVGELGASAVVVAATNEDAVLSGRHTALASQGSVPHQLDQRPAGTGLGIPQITLVSKGWEPIGLGAISDIAISAPPGSPPRRQRLPTR